MWVCKRSEDRTLAQVCVGIGYMPALALSSLEEAIARGGLELRTAHHGCCMCQNLRDSHFFGRKEVVENFFRRLYNPGGKTSSLWFRPMERGMKWALLVCLSTLDKGTQNKEPCPREMGPRQAARHSPSRGEALASGALGPISGAPFLATLDIHLSRPCCRTELMSFVGGNGNGPTENLAHFWPFPSSPPFLEKHRTRWIKSRVWKQLFTHKFIAASKD